MADAAKTDKIRPELLRKISEAMDLPPRQARARLVRLLEGASREEQMLIRGYCEALAMAKEARRLRKQYDRPG
ncbi:MAG: hypothetical protein QN168_12155 [Armatimonadota bacterium]|nr:hypothetical protein [Armatimonadota bacterium]